jgi:hypothetical protein
MNDEFSADEGQSEEGMQFARLNFDAEIEPCFFDEWITKRYGNGTILKEAIGNWIVTLSFSGIGHILKSTDPPPLWEVAEYNKWRRRVTIHEYASEEEATGSFFDAVERYQSEG